MNARVYHVTRRALERYGKKLKREDVRDIDAFALLFGLDAPTRLAVPFRGTWLSVLWTPSRGVVTCLPRNTLNAKMRNAARRVLRKIKCPVGQR